MTETEKSLLELCDRVKALESQLKPILDERHRKRDKENNRGVHMPEVE